MPVSNTRAFQSLAFDQVLPLLASCYEAGRLVPFIGAGMSRPKYADWQSFVENLECAAGLEPSEGGHLDTRAQRATATLRNTYSTEELWEKIGKALRSQEYDREGIPPQTQALAGIYWPLTVSTNYDGLFYCACRQMFADRLPPAVLGRAPEDCKQLMSALVSPFDREIIWHIQGFLGEPCSPCGATPEDLAQLAHLREELVIGHSEYRRTANTAIHFRRCFGEVFRTRSLLFLGSGLSEEYFWNLFGETLELCGPSPVPHFAFLPKKENIDVRFLAEEMNITACQYDHYEDLTAWLDCLKAAIQDNNARISRWRVPFNGGSTLEIAPYAPLPVPDPVSDRAVAVVVRACEKGHFDLDRDLQHPQLREMFDGQVFAANEHLLKVGLGVFAVRARTGPEGEDPGDSVGKAVRELLDRVSEHWSALDLHLPAGGGTVPPVYGFIESVRALGSWVRSAQRPLHVVAHVGPQVLLNLTSRQIGLHELLTSGLIRFWVEVNSEPGKESVRRVLYRDPTASLKDVLTDVLEVSENSLARWSIALCPSPKRVVAPLAAGDLSKSLSDVGIVFGSVLRLRRAASGMQSAESALESIRPTALAQYA